MFWLLSWATSCDPPPPEVDVVVAPAPADADLADRLGHRTASYRAGPDAAGLEALRVVVDEAMAYPSPSLALDAALGDALANGMLRPDLGVPRLERASNVADPAALADAWLRADLIVWSVRHAPGVDPMHPAVQVLAHRSQIDPTVRSADVLAAWRAATLVEDIVPRPIYEADLPVAGMAAVTEVLALLVPGWGIEAATARSRMPGDPDPLMVGGVIPCDSDRRRLDRFTTKNDRFELRRVGEGIDLEPPLRIITLAIRLRPPGGGQVRLGVEMDRVDGRLRWIGCTDLSRCTTLLAAADTMVELQRRGVSDEEIARQVQERHREAFLRGP